MSLLARIWSWFRSVLHPQQLDRDMDDELRFHRESYIEDLVRSGMSLQEATRRARIEFGSPDAHKEAMRVSLGLRLWDDLRSDLRYAFRALKKSPSFTAIALLSLTLGIGVNTTIFTLAKQVMLDRLNVPHPEQLRLLNWHSAKKGAVHHIWGSWDKEGNGATSTSFSYPVYELLRKNNHSLSDLVGFKDIGRMNLTVDGNAETVDGQMVSGNYYQVLGVGPQLGRVLQPYDDQPGATPTIVISDGFWARRFGRSPSVIGKTVLLNFTNVTIVGVNPPKFTGIKGVQQSPEIFVTFAQQPSVLLNREGSLLSNNKQWWMLIMARTKPGVNEKSARAELDVALKDAVRATLNPKPDEALPDLRFGDGSRGLNEAARMYAQPIYVLMSLVGFVLLLACANIANLLLARASARQRELSVRLALGASRRRVLRQVLTESLLLASLGGIGGLIFGYVTRGTIPLLLTNAWDAAPPAAPFDLRVFGFSVALTLITGILFGIAPAIYATRVPVQHALSDNVQTVTRRRKGYAGKAIVGFQIALATMLVLVAGIFLHTILNLNSVDTGIDPRGIVLFEMHPPLSRYPAGKDIQLFRDVEARLAAIPGVEAVSPLAAPLLSNSLSNDDFKPTGYKPAPGKEEVAFDNDVGDDFFRLYHIPIVAGRGFLPTDTETSQRVAVVNRALVKQFFPGENPIGKTFTSSGPQNQDILYQIVGVSADAHYSDLHTDPPPTFYRNFRQSPDLSWGISFAVKTSLSRAAITPSLRQAVQSIDRDLPLMDIRTQQEQIDALLLQGRLFATLSAAFGILALTLACIGIYGIMSYTVARRTNEIGIRLALGARAQQVLGMVLKETSWLATIGVVVGIGGGLLLVRFIRSMLYGLRAYDPASLISAVTILFLVALAAAFVPARRASRIQPMDALRHE